MEDFEKEVFDAAAVTEESDPLRILENGCKALHILSEGETLVELLGCEPWRRGGAESFICSGVISIRTEDNLELERRIILKAYSGFGSSPESKVRAWQERSKELAKHGIPISKVYSVFKGVLFAEFIEWSLIEFLAIHNTVSYVVWAAKNLSAIADRLQHLRAHPVSLLPDLRTDGSLIYLVDFGEDLGEIPGTEEESNFCRSLLKKELHRYGLEDLATVFAG
jgi:hypothetical protein